MSMEWIILYTVWILGTGLLLTIPRSKRRLSLIAFLFTQCLTWPLGLLAVEGGLLRYPVGFFSHANRSSLTFEFYAYPLLCAVFNSRYPAHRSRWIQGGYYAAYSTALTLVEVGLVRYTHVIEYLHWAWYWSWIAYLFTFMATHYFCIWFFRLPSFSPQETGAADDH